MPNLFDAMVAPACGVDHALLSSSTDFNPYEPYLRSTDFVDFPSKPTQVAAEQVDC
jgi:hypothetical protein